MAAVQPDVSPEVAASQSAYLFFSWLSPLLAVGYKRPLQAEDLFTLPEYERIETLLKEYEDAHKHASANGWLPNCARLRHRKSPARPSLLLVLCTMVWRPAAASALLTAVYVGTQVALPILLRLCVQSVQARDMSGAGYACGLSLAVAVGSVANQHALHMCFRMAQRLRAVLIAIVYRRALSSPQPYLSLTDGSKTPKGSFYVSAGNVANLLATDSGRVFDVLPLVHFLWAAPVLIGISTGFLISYLGPPALAGIAVLILLVPIQSSVAKMIGKARKQHAGATDERVKFMSELFAGMRVVKLNGWESAFAQRILQLRKREEECIAQENDYFALLSTLVIITPVAAMVATFTAYTLAGRTQAAADSFAALAFFNVIRFPVNNLSQVVTSAVQLRISLHRIQHFLGESLGVQPVIKKEEETSLHRSAPSVRSELAISLHRASFGWPRDETASSSSEQSSSAGSMKAEEGPVSFELQDIALSVKAGSCVVVTGPVAAGKSSLLLALLGEMPRLVRSEEEKDKAAATGFSGVQSGTQVSYLSQVPWILAGTVRDNITFGCAYNELLYQEVMSACCLWEDCAALSAGDKTVIGERGVTLSGGQKARVGLARAAYAACFNHTAASLLLADDPLSALDAGTGEKVWTGLFGAQGLLAAYNVTRVIVTHSAATLPHADSIVVLHSGRCIFQGAFPALLKAHCGRSTELSPAMGPTSAPATPAMGALLIPGANPAKDAAKSRAATVSPSAFLRALASAHAHSYGPPTTGAHTVVGDAAGAGDSTPSSTVQPSDPQDGGMLDVTVPAVIKQSAKEKVLALAQNADSLHIAEDRAVGNVSNAVYWAWYKAGGGVPWVGILLLGFVVERLTYIGTDFWLAAWTAAAAPPTSNTAGSVSVSPTASGLSALHPLPVADEESRLRFWLAAYVGWGVCNACAAAGRMFTYSRISTHAAKGIFVSSMWGVLRSPMSWFETTPLGRIVNRLSNDVDTVDVVLLQKVNSSTASMFWIASALGVMIAVVPWMVLVLVPVLIVYRTVQTYFQYSVRELQRIESMSRSPLQAHFGESLAGAATIRAFGSACVQQAIAKADFLVDTNDRALLVFNSATRWLGLRLESLGSVIILSIALLAWAAGQTGAGLPPGYAGLALLWSTNLVISFNFNVVFVTETEARMVAVERLMQYVQGLAQEAPLQRGIQDDEGKAVAVLVGEQADLATTGNPLRAKSPDAPAKAPLPVPRLAPSLAHVLSEINGVEMQNAGSGIAAWPNVGVLEFRDVWLRYRPGLPWALRGASFVTKPGEYLSVVGRTGSGKSTLSTALFRLVDDAALLQGTVLVDGVPVRSLGLQSVRGRMGGLAIIPQEPLLFSGSVRFNLDPQGLYSAQDQQAEAKLWAALEAVRLADRFRSSAASGAGVLSPSLDCDVRHEPPETAGLNTTLKEDSLSQGERQLLCLARAMLLNPRLLVLDEATASVDAATDALMNRMVRRHFTAAGTTVISVAHRLSSVVTADRVLVMEAGRVVELGSPYELLCRPPRELDGDLAGMSGREGYGTFSALVQATGPTVAAKLKASAEQAQRHQERPGVG